VGGDHGGVHAIGHDRRDLRNWIDQHQVDEGERDGVSSAAAAEIRAVSEYLA
jgi:hypothetical protein